MNCQGLHADTFLCFDPSTEHHAFESQILLTADAGNCSLLVLLDRVAFDTVDYSVLLDCLHDWVDATLSALKLLSQQLTSASTDISYCLTQGEVIGPFLSMLLFSFVICKSNI